MDQRRFVLLEALKAGALHAGEMRLYQRGRLPGLFGQRTRLNAEVAAEAIGEGWLEQTRTETVGKATVEWVRVTRKGLDHLLRSESPARALDELRSVLALNQQGIPAWVAEMHGRLDALTSAFAAEIAAIRERLDHLADRVGTSLDHLEAPAPNTIRWIQDALAIMHERQQVGLGERCVLADLFTSLKEKHGDLTIRDFHQGLKRMHEQRLLTLLPDLPNGAAPGPECALLDGPVVYYYVGRPR